MKAFTCWKRIAVDLEELLERFLDLLSTSGSRYCLIGGLAVNAYAEPVVSLDLDVVADPIQINAVATALAQRYVVRYFGHAINVEVGCQ
jgi:coenzyme F420-reducing hydrogenase beta subunit